MLCDGDYLDVNLTEADVKAVTPGKNNPGTLSINTDSISSSMD